MPPKTKSVDVLAKHVRHIQACKDRVESLARMKLQNKGPSDIDSQLRDAMAVLKQATDRASGAEKTRLDAKREQMKDRAEVMHYFRRVQDMVRDMIVALEASRKRTVCALKMLCNGSTILVIRRVCAESLYRLQEPVDSCDHTLFFNV